MRKLHLPLAYVLRQLDLKVEAKKVQSKIGRQHNYNTSAWKHVVLAGTKYKISNGVSKLLELGLSCHYCGDSVSHFLVAGSYYSPGALIPIMKNGSRLTIDHIIPRSKKGANVIENMAASCEKCNHAKDNRMPRVDTKKVLSFGKIHSELSGMREVCRILEDTETRDRISKAMKLAYSIRSTILPIPGPMIKKAKYMNEKYAKEYIAVLNNDLKLGIEFDDIYELIPAS